MAGENSKRAKPAALACHKPSLPDTVAAAMLQALRSGRWEAELPSERKLCEILQVSRVSLRPALQRLEQLGWLHTEPGRRRRVVRRAHHVSDMEDGGSIALISPLPLHGFEPFVLLGLDHLRELLSRHSRVLAVETRPECYSRNPGATLERLCHDVHVDVWLLWRSTEQMQKWFHEKRRRHVVVGSAFDPARNSSVDLDHFATARHAAATFGRAGHRRIAIVVPDSGLAGDRDSVTGFVTGAAEYAARSLHADTVSHSGSPEAVFRSVDRLLEFSPKVTAIYSAGGMQTIAIVTRLLQRGVRIPEQMSLISRDDEPGLDFVTPPPARYFRPPIKFARGLFRQIERQLAMVAAPATTVKIVPDFLAKSTLAAPANNDHG